jgi:uncharacterized protein YcbX
LGTLRRTTFTVHLSRIDIFPIKSLEGMSLPESRITSGGILGHDREYAFFDGAGKQVKAKRNPRLHLLRTEFDAGVTEVALRIEGQTESVRFPLENPARIAEWMSGFLGFPVELRRDPASGFPDDTNAFGPTVVSEASLDTVRRWFPQLGLESIRRRFRTNLEIAGMAAFEEDGLLGAPGERKPFSIGEVRLLAQNPCQRCPVPTRDPTTAEPLPGFQAAFSEARERSFPDWGDRRHFDHFYRLAVNTSVGASEAGKILRVGDAVRLTA